MSSMHSATVLRAPETSSMVLSIISPCTCGSGPTFWRISSAHWRRSRLSRSMRASSHSTPSVERADPAKSRDWGRRAGGS